MQLPSALAQENDPQVGPSAQAETSLFSKSHEKEAEKLRESAAAFHARERMEIGLKLAGALVGVPVRLEELEDGWALVEASRGSPLVQDGTDLRLVDRMTGELGRVVAPAAAGYFAFLLARAALPANHLVGVFDGGETGEYEGKAAGFTGSLRLDPNWMEAMRRRTRKNLKAAWAKMMQDLPDSERLAMRKGYSWRLGTKLITLTQPRVPGQTTLEQINIMNRALGLLRKTNRWAAIWGAAKGLENHLTPRGPDVHAHVLVLSRYLDHPEVWRLWRRCITKAWREAGLGDPPENSCFVDIRTAERGGDMTTDAGLDEVCKYITKAEDLLAADEWGHTVSAETLLALCQIDRWPRMFELLGALRPPPAAGRARLDTSCISDGNLASEYWTQARERGEECPESQAIYLLGCIAGERTGQGWGYKSERDEFLAKHRPRPPTWRQLMAQLPLHDWLRMMTERARRAFDYRVGWLKDHNPTLMLVDMNGKLVARQAREVATNEA